jgi:hypothetical protein
MVQVDSPERLVSPPRGLVVLHLILITVSFEDRSVLRQSSKIKE